MGSVFGGEQGANAPRSPGADRAAPRAAGTTDAQLAERFAGGAFLEMASRPAHAAGTAARPRDPDCCRRPDRSPGGADEPGGGPAVDPLARPARPGPARARERLLPGLPVPGAPPSREAAVPAEQTLAPLAAVEVARGRVGCRLLLGL